MFADLGRDAARGHGTAPGGHGASLLDVGPPREYVAAWGVLLGTAVVSLPALLDVPRAVDAAGLVRSRTLAGEWWRLFTAAFVHAGPIHLWLNATAWWAIAAVVERVLGRGPTIAVWLLAAVGGNLASLWWLPASPPTVGASGAILGVTACAAVLTRHGPATLGPHARRQLVGVLAGSAVLTVVGFQFVDWAAHAGGVLVGIVAALAVRRGDAQTTSAGEAMMTSTQPVGPVYGSAERATRGAEVGRRRAAAHAAWAAFVAAAVWASVCVVRALVTRG